MGKEISDLKCFISYAPEDRDTAQSLIQELQKHSVKATSFDETDAKPGHNWSEQIRDVIEQADFCLVLLSKAGTVSKPMLSKEWIEIQRHYWDRPDFAICPIQLADADTNLPVFLRGWPIYRFDSAAKTVQQVLKGLPQQRERPVKDSEESMQQFRQMRHAIRAAAHENIAKRQTYNR